MSTPPILGLTALRTNAVFIGFTSASQDIVLDAYRIEAARVELQSMMSAAYIAGYRVGMLVAGGTGFLMWLATETFVFFPAFLGMGVVLGMVFSQAAARRHH